MLHIYGVSFSICCGREPLSDADFYGPVVLAVIQPTVLKHRRTRLLIHHPPPASDRRGVEAFMPAVWP